MAVHILILIYFSGYCVLFIILYNFIIRRIRKYTFDRDELKLHLTRCGLVVIWPLTLLFFISFLIGVLMYVLIIAILVHAGCLHPSAIGSIYPSDFNGPGGLKTPFVPKLVKRLRLHFWDGNSSSDCSICLEEFTHPEGSVVEVQHPLSTELDDTVENIKYDVISQCSSRTLQLFDDDTCVTSCGHYFHYKCLNKWLKNQLTCPKCRGHIDVESCSAIYNISLLQDSTTRGLVRTYQRPDEISSSTSNNAHERY